MNKMNLPYILLAALLFLGFVICAPLVNAQGTGLRTLGSNGLSRNLEAAVANRLRVEPFSRAGTDKTSGTGAVNNFSGDCVDVNSSAENSQFGSCSTFEWPSVEADDFSPKTAEIFQSPSKASLNPQTNSPKQSPNVYVFPSRHERVRHYIKGVIGPTSFASAAAGALYNHAYNRPQEWGKSGNALAKRFFSAFGRGSINETVKFGLSETLKLDSSFHKSTRSGFRPRAADAIFEAVTSRTRSGRRVVSIPRLTAPYAASFASLLWMPKRYGPEYSFRSGTYSILGSMAFNLAREFILRK